MSRGWWEKIEVEPLLLKTGTRTGGSLGFGKPKLKDGRLESEKLGMETLFSVEPKIFCS